MPQHNLPTKQYEVTALVRTTGPAAKIRSTKNMAERLIGEIGFGLYIKDARVNEDTESLEILLCAGDTSSPSRIDLVIPLKSLKEVSRESVLDAEVSLAPTEAADYRGGSPEKVDGDRRQVGRRA